METWYLEMIRSSVVPHPWISRCGEAHLYLGDCRDVLPRLAPRAFVAVITDPPYGVGRPLDWIPMAAGLLRPGGGMIAWTDVVRAGTVREAFLAAGVKPHRILAWWKYDAPPNFRKNWPSQLELAVFGRFPGRVLRWHYQHARDQVIRASQNPREQRIHPMQKPLDVVTPHVLAITDPGDTIVDPFMGSGSIGVAALRHGRGYIGIESDPEYFGAAVARIEAELAQGRL